MNGLAKRNPSVAFQNAALLNGCWRRDLGLCNVSCSCRHGRQGNMFGHHILRGHSGRRDGIRGRGTTIRLGHKSVGSSVGWRITPRQLQGVFVKDVLLFVLSMIGNYS